MLTDLEFAIHRFAGYAKTVLAPAIYGARRPLDLAAFQCADPIPHAQAVRATYKPVEIGWRWGPAWSTAWFHLTGRVPSSMAGQTVALRFSSGTEALLWDDGVPRRGFDVNHDSFVLLERAAGDERIDLFIEAACNHPWGIGAFDWDPPGTQERWNSPAPGDLQYCELAVYNPTVWRLWHIYEFTRQLMSELPADAARTQVLYEALRQATRRIDDNDVAAGADDVIALLRRALRGAGGADATDCFAIGHAHIDTAWLWRTRQTRRKCLRTFATVLDLMERYPQFTFLYSQPQQYLWLEETSPALFDKIAQRIREGRWEPAGVMWVEPDCCLPSGESLVRQLLYGHAYYTDRFGDDAPRRYAYLPDTFGFPASLPQILAQAGLDTFITNKMAWNQVNDWPYVHFRWRGIDGTEIVAHCTPGEDYNATNSPMELRRGERNAARKTRGRAMVWLQPFGHGDGGGGPTDAMVNSTLLAAQCEGLPRTHFARADAFCDELHRRRAELVDRSEDLPVWDGELYLELHRGTCTTQAWIKKANRRAETALRIAEWLLSCAPDPLDDAERRAHTDHLHEAWKLTLLNQFHDILPGTSIASVFDDARLDYTRTSEICTTAIEAGMSAWTRHFDTTPLDDPLIVFNPLSRDRSGVIEYNATLHYVRDVPALGAAVIDRSAPPDVHPVEVSDRTLSNGVIEATIDACGCITNLRTLPAGDNICAPAPGSGRSPINHLVLYEDRPQSWEAWDIDAQHREKAYPVNGPADEWRIIDAGSLRAVIEVSRSLGRASRIVQRFILCAGSPRLDIHTYIDWHEARRLLRALFPVDIRARTATYEIQFGHIERETHANTTWQQAMFEVCAHTWMDLSMPGRGLALLNDCKYGHSCDGNVMGLSLLRSCQYPDPAADMGEHEFTYGLMPHHGDWRAAGVDHEAHALNSPFIARPLSAHQHGSTVARHAPFHLDAPGAARADVTAVKSAHDNTGALVLRLVETHGGTGPVHLTWNLPVRDVQPADLLERPATLDGFDHDSAQGRTSLILRPFQIVTLKANLAP